MEGFYFRSPEIALCALCGEELHPARDDLYACDGCELPFCEEHVDAHRCEEGGRP